MVTEPAHLLLARQADDIRDASEYEAHRKRVEDQRKELKYLKDTAHFYEDVDVLIGYKKRPQ